MKSAAPNAQEHTSMGLFERYLSLWVGGCILIGVGLGLLIPGAFQTLSRVSYASVNFVVAVLIWVMIYPMMVNVDFSSLKDLAQKPKGLCLTLVINWLIKPFTMAGLALLFFGVVFQGWISPEEAQSYSAGLILLGAAPCTAMVFVWSHMVKGDANYTLVQVAVNDTIMLFAFAPLVALLLGLTRMSVPWETLLLSTVLYVLIPLIAGYITRTHLSRSGHRERIAIFTAQMKPFSMLGLLLMVVLLFGFQAHTLLARPQLVLLIATPLLIQSYGIFAIAYGLAYLWRLPFAIAAPAAFIGTSNFFELAVAVAIGLFGLHSGAALATVVGVLVEVPVMLSLVAFARRTQKYFDKAPS